MTHRLVPLLVALLVSPLFFAHAQAQEAPPRSVELRIVAMSRGYMRPMSATAERIAAVDGISSAEMLGFAGDTARYKVATRLDNAALAKALQLQVLSGGDGTLTLAAEINARAQHAEARGVLMQIALAILDKPRPAWSGKSDRLFKRGWTLAQKLESLGLSVSMLNGAAYKPSQYHVDENWSGPSATYKVWAGDKDESVYVPDENDPWTESGPDQTKTKADPDSNYVGIQVSRTAWHESITWVDVEGIRLNGFSGRRSDTDSEGELYVKKGADWLKSILQAVGALCVHKPNEAIKRLPHGAGWQILQQFNNQNLRRWGLPHYNIQDFQMQWREENDHKICNLRAHNPEDPFYLEADLDATDVIADYKKRKEKDDSLDIKSLQSAELGDALTWICGAEDGPEVFAKRRDEAAAGMKLVREAIAKARATHSLVELCGRLDDAELVKRLGLELPADGYFKPGDYAIRVQMLGDVEIAVGNARSGGRCWQLVNAATAKVFRSN